MGKGRRSEWQIKNIDEAKRRIKAQLDSIQEKAGERQRFQAIQQGIRQLESSTEPKDLLDLYVYIVSALVHHKNFGGLNPSQIRKMTSLAYQILQMQDIQPETSQLGFLYGEIHMALSQIHRISGEHLTAAWEQQFSQHVSRKHPPGGPHYQALASAIRSMRLGQVHRALENYILAAEDTTNRRRIWTARLGQIRCLRLMQQFEEASQLIRSMFDSINIHDEASERFQLELHWEKICIDASKEANLDAMIQAVNRKSSHYQAVYLVEAHLWSLAAPQRRWQGRLPKVATILRNKKLQSKDLGFFVKAAQQLEECHDSQIPLVVRVRALGHIIGDLHHFIAIDRQLLFYIAAARWLARIHSPELASIMLGEYEGYSLKITRGHCNDVLNLAGDILDRPWFR